MFCPIAAITMNTDLSPTIGAGRFSDDHNTESS